MADVVNLNRARKARARVAAQTQAAANSIAFGRTRAERLADQADAERRQRQLEGLRRDP